MSGLVIMPDVLLFLRIVFAIMGSLLFQVNLEIALTLWRIELELWWGLHWICRLLLANGHFYYINPANPWAWEIFPSSEKFFNFFLQRLEVLIIQSFHFPGFLLFQMNLQIALFISMKNWVGIFTGTALNLYIALGKMGVFTILTLPIHEHGRSFHLLRSSSNSFFRDLRFFIQIFHLFS